MNFKLKAFEINYLIDISNHFTLFVTNECFSLTNSDNGLHCFELF